MDIEAHPQDHPGEPINSKKNGINLDLANGDEKYETVERAYSMASYPAEGRNIC